MTGKEDESQRQHEERLQRLRAKAAAMRQQLAIREAAVQNLVTI